MRLVLPDDLRLCRRRVDICGREIMPIVANRLVMTSLIVFTTLAAMQAKAANVEATSAVDAVTVYPMAPASRAPSRSTFPAGIIPW